MEEQNDHDAITKLVVNVENLKASQENFHREVKEALKDLKDNYSERLNEHEKRLAKLETAKIRQNVLISIGIGLLSLLTGLLIYHIVYTPIQQIISK